MADPLGVTVCGATGATGGLAVRLLLETDGFVLRGALAAPDDPRQGEELFDGVRVTHDATAGLAGAHALIDFSSPAAVEAMLPALEARPIPAAFGTTALPTPTRQRLEALAERVPLLIAPNMGLGINLLRRLVRQAATMAGSSWDVEIVEVHHRRKVDAPSGTALALARDVAEATGGDRSLVRGRDGDVGPRTAGEIGVQAVRGGDVVGEHTVMLLGAGERLELVHRATDRTTFAAGALRAVHWLATDGRRPGLYTMDDVLDADDRS